MIRSLQFSSYSIINLPNYVLIFSFPPISSRTESHKHGLAAKYSFKMVASEVPSCETNFFTIAGTSKAETLVKGKTWMFTCYRRIQKSKLFGVTFLKLKKIPRLLMLRFIFHWLERKILEKKSLQLDCRNILKYTRTCRRRMKW